MRTKNSALFKMKFALCALILLLRCNYCFCNNVKRFELINVITDFLMILNQPVRISTDTLCWEKRDFVHLTKSLNRNGFLTTPSKGKLSTYWPHEQQMFMIDLACENSQEALLTGNKLNLLEYPFKWLIIQESNGTELLPNLNIFVRSKIYILQKDLDGYKVISKYRLGKFSKEYHTNEIAAWKGGKFEYYNALIDHTHRRNLMKLTVNSSMVIYDPETTKHLLDGRDTHTQPMTKVDYRITLQVLEAMNATPHFIVRDTWGFRKPNSSKFDNGMIGDSQNKLAEILATGAFVRPDRVAYIEAIASTTRNVLAFVFRAPPLSTVKNIYVLPFHSSVWLACMGLFCISPVIFYIITYWEMSSNAFDAEEVRDNVLRLQPEVAEVVQIQIGAICQQGSDTEPISLAGRVATIILFISTLFLYTSYSANIVTLLQSTSDSIKTVPDLLYTKIKLGCEDIVFHRYYFSSATGKVEAAINREKMAPPGKPENYMDIHQGVKRMREEFFAFHAEAAVIYKLVRDTFEEHEKCGLTEIIIFNMFEAYYHMAKNTTYGELFKVIVRKMGERGLVSRVYNRLYSSKPPCLNQGGTFLSVSLTDCYAAFFIYGIGSGVAIFFLFVEKIYYHRKIMRKPRNRTLFK